jgi:N-acetylglutamate synthase-like GNAT family acetyltransferase
MTSIAPQFEISVSGNLLPDELGDLLGAVGMSVYTQEKLAGVISGSSAYVTVRDAGKLIGFGRLLSDGATLAYINNMAVAPSYQRQGIGKMILNKLIEIAGEVNSIFLYTNTADSFYMRHGFQPSEKRLYILRSNPLSQP